MTASIDLWTASLCKPDPGYGGWAHVRRNADGTLAGAAGGERRVNGAKMVLTGVIEALTALADLPADTAVTLHFADPALAAELVTGDGAYATAEPEAWADFGLDTAKTRGTFKAAIPRPNLLKFPG